MKARGVVKSSTIAGRGGSSGDTIDLGIGTAGRIVDDHARPRRLTEVIFASRATRMNDVLRGVDRVDALRWRRSHLGGRRSPDVNVSIENSARRPMTTTAVVTAMALERPGRVRIWFSEP